MCGTIDTKVSAVRVFEPPEQKIAHERPSGSLAFHKSQTSASARSGQNHRDRVTVSDTAAIFPFPAFLCIGYKERKPSSGR